MMVRRSKDQAFEGNTCRSFILDFGNRLCWNGEIDDPEKKSQGTVRK